MCKYCENEDVYNDDDGTYFLLEDCKKCGMQTFNEIEDEECCDDVISYSITKYENACEEEYGITSMCRCGCEGEYILVTVKEYIEDAGRVVDYQAWLGVEEMQLDLEIDFTECQECGNKKDLYYEVNKEEDSATLSITCPKCHCIEKYDL